jgi:flagellar hook-associated protein 2
MSQLSLSGAVSGIDTASLINSLVSVQQNQQTLLKTQQSQQQKAADAFGSLISSLGTLSSQAKTVANTKAWNGLSATSSSTGVTVKTTGTQASSLSFDVTSVARAHALVSHEGVGSLGAQVASGPLTFTKADASTVDVSVGNGSLAEVVAAVNASSAGVSATAVQTSPGQYRLQLTSTETGAASEFSVSGLDGFSAVDTLAQGADAQISVGSNPSTAYTVSSSSNTFSGVVTGLSFTVSQVESGVSISSAIDGSPVADNLQKLVDAANAVLSGIDKATAWNATTKSGGALVGDSTARGLQQSILSMVGSTTTPGISVNRNGQLTFDRTTFLDAFAEDPLGVAGKYGADSTFTAASGVSGTVRYSSALSSTQAGSYAVHVSSPAATEVWTVDGSGGLDGQTLTISRGGTTASYTVDPGDTLEDIATGLNQAAVAAGLTIGTSVDGSSLMLSASGAGTSGAFTTTTGGATATRTVAGADVAGTLDGYAAEGSGSILTLVTTGHHASGLSVEVTVDQDDIDATGGDVGSVEYTTGLARRLVQFVQQQTESGTGMLSSAKAGRESAVKSLQSQIDDWDTRLTAYRASLQAQFTAMETTLATLQSQSSFLSSYTSG